MYVLLYCGVCTSVRLLPRAENPIAVIIIIIIIIISTTFFGLKCHRQIKHKIKKCVDIYAQFAWNRDF
jgi:hypothetical protein